MKYTNVEYNPSLKYIVYVIYVDSLRNSRN
jgi:hypothetical protein